MLLSFCLFPLCVKSGHSVTSGQKRKLELSPDCGRCGTLRRARRANGEAAAGRSWRRSPLRGIPCRRAGLAKLPDLGINTLAVRRDAGITVNRDIGFSDGAKLPGCCTSLNE